MALERELLVLQPYSGLRVWNSQYLDWSLVRHSSLETASLYLNNSETSVGIIDCSESEKPSFRLARWLDNYNGVSWIAVLSQRQLLKSEWQLFIAMHCYDYHTTPVSEDRLFITIGRAYGMTRLKNKLSLSFQKGEVIGRHERFQSVLVSLQSHKRKYLTLSGEQGTGKRLLAKNFSELRGLEFIELDANRIEPGAYISHFESITSQCSRQPVCLYINGVEQIPGSIQSHISNRVLDENLKLVFGCGVSSNELDNVCFFIPEFTSLLRRCWIEVPPLRERGRDKLILAKYYLYKISRSQGKQVLGFSNDAECAIDKYHWPGNVTELIEKVISGLSRCETEYLNAEAMELNDDLIPECSNLSLRKAREEADALAIKRVLDLVSGRPGRAAELLCISRASLHRLIARYGIRR
ncbi:VpsR-related response regulator [Zobellella maritima]|uniref:VpsR-related response regulator n=1 Tax=Zobellella maritima TaxID=2059725 RepID=UPI000E30574B|nr:VpsR-related response regulator [Zobellella maritima]